MTMTVMRAVGAILKTFPGSRVLNSPPNSPPLSPSAPPTSQPMAGDFMQGCDYCGGFGSCRWVYDRDHDEDKVACEDCRVTRGLDITPDRRLAEDAT